MNVGLDYLYSAPGNFRFWRGFPRFTDDSREDFEGKWGVFSS
jgi:hypothetical protein